MPSKSMTEEARHRLGELQNDIPALLARHIGIKAQIIEQEREIAYATGAAEAWKHRNQLRILYTMARILVRRISGLKKEIK